MGTTPNFGWTYPPATNYVKDLPTNLGDLADEIDATVFGLGSSPDTILASANFTAQSAINLSSVLSDTYRFYSLKINFVASTSMTLAFKFRENTTDKSTSYYVSNITVNTSGTVANRNSASNTTAMSLTDGDVYYSAITLDIFRPSATIGLLTHQSMNPNTSAQLYYGGAQNAGMTNFNGISILPSTGTITGTYVLTGRKI